MKAQVKLYKNQMKTKSKVTAKTKRIMSFNCLLAMQWLIILNFVKIHLFKEL